MCVTVPGLRHQQHQRHQGEVPLQRHRLPVEALPLLYSPRAITRACCRSESSSDNFILTNINISLRRTLKFIITTITLSSQKPCRKRAEMSFAVGNLTRPPFLTSALLATWHSRMEKARTSEEVRTRPDKQKPAQSFSIQIANSQNLSFLPSRLIPSHTIPPPKLLPVQPGPTQ